MIKFDDKYFVSLKHSKEQTKKIFDNALRDFNIAQQDKIPEVKFNYSYTALIKSGIAILTTYDKKVKSIPGHHIMIIEKISQILKDKTVANLGNAMRSKRNSDLYDGGVFISEKESREYLLFVESVLTRIKKIISI